MFRGYELKFAHSIAEAEPLIADQEFDLYILDNWLPDGSGVELCKKIRRAKPDTPIVFTSAVAFQKSVDEATAAGANRYLVKPIEPDQLKQVVKELLSDDYNLSI